MTNNRRADSGRIGPEAVVAEFGRRESWATLGIMSQLFFGFCLAALANDLLRTLMVMMMVIAGLMPLFIVRCPSCSRSLVTLWAGSLGIRPEDCPGCGVRLRPAGKPRRLKFLWCALSFLCIPTAAMFLAYIADRIIHGSQAVFPTGNRALLIGMNCLVFSAWLWAGLRRRSGRPKTQRLKTDQ